MTKNIFAVFRFRPVMLVAAAAAIAFWVLGAGWRFWRFRGRGWRGAGAGLAWRGCTGCSGAPAGFRRYMRRLFPVAAALVVYYDAAVDGGYGAATAG